MAKYYQRKDGLYESIRRINGKRVAFRGKTCREVDRKILEYKEKAALGEKFPVRADEWERMREAEVSESTRRVYSFALRRLKEAFPGYVKDIRPLDIKRYLSAFEAKGYKKDTVNTELSVLKQVLSYAVLQGDIDTNPAREVKPSRGLERTVRTALTHEQEQLVKNCRTGDWWLLGMFLLYSGGRRGEVLALTWEDIDFTANVIHFRKKLNYAFGNTPKLENHMKTANGLRDTPLLPDLAAVLPRNRIGKIFHDGDGQYLTASRLNRVWLRYCRDAGLMTTEGGKEKPAVTPHQFRHSFATLCYEADIDIRTAAAWMGDTPEVVSGVYQELRAAKKETGAEKLAEFLASREA